ncbi:metabotropic glutamate receptor 1-like [Amphiura filiformis]|uniref:metabotropic glutamate receptor 1-like n=1 Tax=Amphiura filiformis TaxID=82378 RepID=UPI003B21654C
MDRNNLNALPVARILVITTIALVSNCASFKKECSVHFQDGDFIIGGIFPVYLSVQNPCDGSFTENHGVPKVETMTYAISMVNNRTDILPNVQLGYEIRTDCYSEEVSMWTMISLAGPCRNQTYHLQCPSYERKETIKKVLGVIGPGNSATSLYVAKAAEIFHVPAIAYSASSDELSNNNRFPYFFRTVPPDKFQVGAIIDLLLRFNWKYIGLYFSIDSYGVHGAQQIRTLADSKDICIAINTPLPNAPSPSEMTDIVNGLKNVPYVSVVVVFALEVPALALLNAIKNGQIGRKITLIGSDGWGGNEIIEAGFGHLTHGSVFIRFHSPQDLAFRKYWHKLEESSHPVSPWYDEFKDYWKSSHSCESMSTCPFPPASETFVINGVLALAYALNATLQQCQSPIETCYASLDESKLRDNLLAVQFDADNGEFRFDENGDSSGKFIFLNLKQNAGKYVFEEVGQWDPDDSIDLQDDVIQWGGWSDNEDEVPKSVCKEDCLPGFIEVPLSQKCCWGCRRCPNNSIVINATICKVCPQFDWPNGNFTTCEPLIPVYISWISPVVLILVACPSIGILLTVFTAVEMWLYRDHPSIKACSRELSAIMLFGIFLSFVTPFTLLLPSTIISCTFSEIFMSFSFLLCFASTLLKVNRIYRIFSAGKKSASRPKFVGPKAQLLMLLLFVVLQIIISVLTFFWSPSKPKPIDNILLTGSLHLYCSYGYGFVASLTYNFMLIVSCCFYAFKTRKVPSNYNESRFIAISVYSTLIVCLSALPVYLTGSSVLHKVSTISTALILNGYLTLVLLFLPKIYAAKYLRAEMAMESWRSATATGNINRVGVMRGNSVETGE